MTLSLIVGPPNSGRTGKALEVFRGALERDPLLVVPTADDAELFEGELAANGLLLGGAIVTFGGLVGEVANALELPWGPGSTRAQDVWLAREAASRVDLGVLQRSSERAGFAPALADLLEELKSAGLDPDTFAELAAEAGPYEGELASLFAERDALAAARGVGDRHALARAITARVRTEGASAWSGRPVVFYGFDELNGEQLELVGALAAVTEVTVAVTYEDRAALAARAKLLGELRELVPAELLVSESELETDPSTTPNETLRHLERGFLEPDADRRDPGEGLLLMRAAGERAEAELVAAEVARLLAEGVPPERIAIVLRSPARHGALWRRVLTRLGIPVAVEASAPLSVTACGRAMASLARLAGGQGTAADLVDFLRAPGRAPSGLVDRLEREVRRQGLRSAAEAERAWARLDGARELFELAELREAAAGEELLRTAARLARMIAEHPLAGGAEVPGPERSLELRAAAEAERALLDVAGLGAAEAGPAELEEILAEARVRLHEGAVRGRVRVVSPYRLRARRVSHLFVASLQEDEFPRRDPGSPLLGDERRRELGIAERAPAEQEERYLFAVCLSRPERGLALSWRHMTDEGRAAARSPFVDEVRDLLSPPQPDDPEEPDPLMETIGVERGPSAVVAEVSEASSARELARAIAVRGRDGWHDALIAAGARDETEAAIRVALEGAEGAGAERRLRPRDLRSEAVLEALAEEDLFGGTTLEAYELCSYRWFVGHELRPQRLDPAEEGLALGGLAHRALERLFTERPDGTPRPTPASLATWRARAGELVAECAAESELPQSDPVVLAQIRRVEGLIASHLADEAAADRVLVPDTELLEASFGEGPDSSQPPLELDGLRLHGKIDRVDVADGPTGRIGLVTDYKLSSQVTTAAKLAEEGKLQLQLYSLALRRLWDIDPAGAIYVPMRATSPGKRRPRGMMRRELADRLEGFDTVPTDLLPDEDFEETLAEAERAASRIAGDIYAGRVRRDPQGGECPRFCRWQLICRRERGMAEADEDEVDEP